MNNACLSVDLSKARLASCALAVRARGYLCCRLRDSLTRPFHRNFVVLFFSRAARPWTGQQLTCRVCGASILLIAQTCAGANNGGFIQTQSV